MPWSLLVGGPLEGWGYLLGVARESGIAFLPPPSSFSRLSIGITSLNMDGVCWAGALGVQGQGAVEHAAGRQQCSGLGAASGQNCLVYSVEDPTHPQRQRRPLCTQGAGDYGPRRSWSCGQWDVAVYVPGGSSISMTGVYVCGGVMTARKPAGEREGSQVQL